MTDRIAIALGLAILAMFAIDHFAFSGDLPLFLARKIFDLVAYIAFWR